MSAEVKIRVRQKYMPDDVEIHAYKTQMPDETAALAFEFLERWGLVAAIPDGEDSAGRAKLRLPTTSELVGRAFDIAEAAMSCARARGHLVALPDLNELNAEADAKAEGKKAARREADQA